MQAARPNPLSGVAGAGFSWVYNNFLMGEKSKIYYARSTDFQPFLEKLRGVFEPKLKGKILIKPNAVSHEPYPTTTSPELFRGLIRLLKGRAELAAGDAPAADLPRPGYALKNYILTRVAEEEGIRFYNFYEQAMIEEQTNLGRGLKFSALPKKFDLIISLPVLKTHIILLITAALKNQFGFLAREQRLKLHLQGGTALARAIVSINQLAPAQLFIVDFRETLINANELRHGGRRMEGGWIFAGEDPLALDFFGFSLLKEIEPKLFGKSPQEIEYLRLAQSSGLGRSEFELVQL